MESWGWQRAGDSFDDRAVSCYHDMKREALRVPIEASLDSDDGGVQIKPCLNIVHVCKICGHIKIEREQP